MPFSDARTVVCASFLLADVAMSEAACCAPRRACGRVRRGRIWACCGRVLARCRLFVCFIYVAYISLNHIPSLTVVRDGLGRS